MALIVEDGTGKNNSESFVSVAEYATFWGLNDPTKVTGTQSEQEAAARRATAYLCASFDWDGVKAKARAQALAWPRVGCADREQNPIEGTEIPIELKTAQFHLMALELATPNALNPNVTLSDKVKTEKVGNIQVEYENANLGVESYRPIIALVDDLLSPFLKSQNNSVFSYWKY